VSRMGLMSDGALLYAKAVIIGEGDFSLLHVLDFRGFAARCRIS